MLFMIGGIPGTFHHLYFASTTTPIAAIGAMFSALEVVPLVLLSIPYMLWIDTKLVEPRDGAWALGAWLMGRDGLDREAIRRMVASL